MIETDRFHDFGIDDVAQYVSRTHRGKLVHVPDQNQGAGRGHGLEQAVHKHDVDHGNLVENHYIGFQRVGFVADKSAAQGREFEQPVNSAGFFACDFGESFRGTSGRRSQCYSDLFIFQYPHQAVD